MEVRKLDSGMRAWNARPGEHYLQTTGQKSGLWKNLGRPPQKLTGVGFISQGFDSARPFRRMPDSWHRTVSTITEGIEARSSAISACLMAAPPASRSTATI